MKHGLFRTAGMAAVISSALVGCDSGIEENLKETQNLVIEQDAVQPHITFHTYLLPESRHRLGIPRAEKFLEQYGVDVKFVMYDNKEDVPESDHIHNIPLIEISPEEWITIVDASRINRDDPRVDAVIDKEIKERAARARERTIPHPKKSIEELMEETRKLKDEYLRAESEVIGGQADLREGRIYLVRNPETHTAFNILVDSYELTDSLQGLLSKEAIEESKADLMHHFEMFANRSAKTIVHEILHIAGLPHSFQYKTDAAEDFVAEDMPNVMSYEVPSGNGIGFALIPEQEEHMRAYFSGGQPFKEMVSLNFEPLLWTDALDKKYSE